MIYSSLIQKIEEYSIITIFRHVNPDCDAVGSQFGLQNWIRENWPDKQVYAVGIQECHQGIWPMNDNIADEVIEQSLAIVVDTANKERVDDQRFLSAKEIIKIDHHPNVQPYGDLMFVDDQAAAVCQILSDMMHQSDLLISEKTASCLYKGLLTDTLNYTTSNTTQQTLYQGSLLASHNIRIPELAREVFDRSRKEFTFAGYLRSHVKVENDAFAYVELSQDQQEESGMIGSDARNFVDELGHVKDFRIWCIFTEKIIDGNQYFDASIRSKNIVINDVASMFGGGGHPNASGIKDLTFEQKENVKKKLILKLS